MCERNETAKMVNSSRVFVVSLLVLLFATSLIGDSVPVGSAISTSTKTAFVWLFGYIGENFYPKTQLNLSQQQMYAIAAQLRHSLGLNASLNLVSAVDETPGNQIAWSNKTKVAPILSYVGFLRQYGQVYGRIDLQEFNTTTKTKVYTEVGRYANTLFLNGVWLDHAAVLYSENKTTFNNMMQNLTNSYPNLEFILNQAYKESNSAYVIVPAANTTWANNCYISPSILSGSYDKIPASKQLAKWNEYYPGRVLIHFDAFATKSYEPMGLFANQDNLVEVQTMQKLASKGLTLGYMLLYPIIGAWTFKDSLYKGTLYNSLTTGNYPRSTLTNFTQIMVNYSPR